MGDPQSSQGFLVAAGSMTSDDLSLEFGSDGEQNCRSLTSGRPSPLAAWLLLGKNRLSLLSVDSIGPGPS